MQANGQTPHSLGGAWGFNNSIGGHIAFGETNAFSGSVTPPTTTTSGLQNILSIFFD